MKNLTTSEKVERFNKYNEDINSGETVYTSEEFNSDIIQTITIDLTNYYVNLDSSKPYVYINDLNEITSLNTLEVHELYNSIHDDIEEHQKEGKEEKANSFIAENCNFNFIDLAKECKPKKINLKKVIKENIADGDKTNIKNKDIKRVYISYNSDLIFLTDGKAPNLKEKNYKAVGYLGDGDICDKAIDPFHFFESEEEEKKHLKDMLKIWNEEKTFLTFHAYYNITDIKKVLTNSIQATENLRESLQLFNHMNEDQKTLHNTIKEMEKNIMEMFNGLESLTYETIKTAIL